MSYTQITAENSETIDQLIQKGEINLPAMLSASAQRLGSSQPIFTQVGQRAEMSRLELRRVVSDISVALQLQASLQFCQGRKCSIVDKDGVTHTNIFVSKSTPTKRVGNGGEYLVECVMDLEALPETSEQI